MTRFKHLAAFLILSCTALLPLTSLAATDSEKQPVLRGPAELMLWVKGDNIKGVANGAPVAQWPDSSGRGYHLTSEGALRPTLTTHGIAGKPALRFTATDNPKASNRMDAPWINQEWHGVTMFVVATNLSGSAWLGTSGGMGDIRFIGGGVQHCNTEAGMDKPFGEQGTDVPLLFSFMEGMDSQGFLHLSTYVDGLLQKTSVSKQHFYSVTMNKTMFGAYADWERALNGLIAEIIVYRGPLTAEQRAVTENYLMSKYKLGGKRSPAPAPWGYPVPAVEKAQTASKSLPPIKAEAPTKRGLLRWFAADQIVKPEPNGPITQIPNLAGDRKPVVSDGPDRPLYIPGSLGNRPVVRFEQGKKQSLNLNLSPGVMEAMTVIVVGRNLRNDGLLDTAPGSPSTLRGNAKGYQFCGIPNWGGGGNPTLDYFPDGQITSLSFECKEDGSAKIASWAHGAAQGRNEVKKETCTTPFKIENMHLGVQDPWYRGDIAEVLIWDRWLSDIERKKAEQYLAEKYSLLLVEDKAAAVARSPYSLRYPRLPSRQSWVHNTFPGKDSWVQGGMWDMTALPDGTVLACSVWDECHKEIGFYKDGKPQMVKAGEPPAADSPFYNKGLFNGHIAALCVDKDYIYAGASGMGKPQIGLRRFQLSDLQEKPFPNTKVGTPVWTVPETPGAWKEFTGMAIAGQTIYAGSQGFNMLRLIDAGTGLEKSAVKLPEQPGRILAVPDTKTLWIALQTKVIETDLDGKATGREIGGVKPAGLALDSKGRLLLAENGDRMQIIYYDISAGAPKEVDTLGEPGGIWKAKRVGEMGPDRFYDLKSVGTDKAGNTYVLCGSELMRGYGPDKKMLWQMEATSFCTVGDIDPASDGDDIHTQNWHHTRRTAVAPGESEWELRGAAFTPSQQEWRDGVSDQNVQIRRLGGRLFKCQLANDLRVWEQLPGAETFVPRALWAFDGREWSRPAFLPKAGLFAWSDLNGDGKGGAGEITNIPAERAFQNEPNYDIFIDSLGGLWEGKGRQGIRHLPMKKLGEHGPIYDAGDVATFPRPPEFVEVNRAQYYPESDTMYISGQTWESAMRNDRNYGWGLIGREIVRYADWSKPTRREVSRMVVPSEVESPRVIAITEKNELCFVGDMTSSVIFVYDTRNGKLMGIVEADRPTFGFANAWIDQSGGLRAFTKKNGEVVLVVEDSGWAKAYVFTLPAELPGRSTSPTPITAKGKIQ